MSADVDPRPFRERARAALEDPGLRRTLPAAVDRQAAARVDVLASLDDADGLRDLAARIRDSNLARLDEHLERLAETWEAAGGRVFFADDASEAVEHIVDLATRCGATSVVKAKSMVSEEVGLNEALLRARIEPIETDLGQYIVQLAQEPPSHIVAPSIHKSKAQVAALFGRVAGETLPEDAHVLTGFARRRLRDAFLSARVGISGVNFAVASEGTLALVTNEGNGRMCTSLPPVHIALMGMERVVWDFPQLAVMLELLARSSTGQKLSQYTSLLHGPRRRSEADGPDESHLVILDNGRSRLLGTRYQTALRCIRCGACLNVCPVFRQVGGHAYDPVYSGPIGAVITPLLRRTDASLELAHASTLCAACTDVCPVRIPLHEHLLHLRQDYARSAAPKAERAAYGIWSRAWSGPRLFRLSTAPVARAARILKGRALARLPIPLLGRWTRGRALALPGRTARSRPAAPK